MVTTWLAPGAMVKEAGEMLKKLPLCVSVVEAGALPTLERENPSVAPGAPIACSMPPGSVPTMTRPPAPSTVTVADAVALPPGPPAVRVYVVVCFGEMRTFPDALCVPTPLSIDTELELMVDQESVAESPALMVEGLAVKLEMAGPGVAVEDRVREKVKDVDSLPGF